MAGTKVVTFDFEFQYSHGGRFHKEFAVTLRAPGLKDFKTHNMMTGYAKRSEIGLAAAFSGIRQQRDPLDVPDPEKEEEPVIERSEEEELQGVLSSFAAGLGPEHYPAFANFVLEQLKGNSRLCTIGDTTAPLTDEVLDGIVQAGGMSAVDRLVGGFASFFMADRLKSRSATGASSSTTVASQPVAH
jgi:hypothetical protein